jgi:hypothetical protein
MPKTNRRQFLATSGTALGLAVTAAEARPHAASARRREAGGAAPGGGAGGASAAGSPTALYNTNLQTAVGMGDEPAGMVDQFGQLKTRHVETALGERWRRFTRRDFSIPTMR